MKPGRRRHELKMVGEVTRNGVGKHLVPFPVDGGRATDVTCEVTVIDETRECRL